MWWWLGGSERAGRGQKLKSLLAFSRPLCFLKPAGSTSAFLKSGTTASSRRTWRQERSAATAGNYEVARCQHLPCACLVRGGRRNLRQTDAGYIGDDATMR